MGNARTRVLFSRKDDWEPGMRAAMRRHAPYFQDWQRIDADQFDLVVPLTLKDARLFNRDLPHLNAVKALVPSDAAINACDDKQAFAAHLAKAGFARWLPMSSDVLPYPYVLKKRISEWGEDSYIIHSAADEHVHAERMCSQEYLKQECVSGHREYTSHILMAGGRNVFMRTLEFTFDRALFVKGRATCPRSQARVDHSRYGTLFEDILKCVDLQGFCCFNYKLRDGAPKIFEVNPRYGASMTLFLDDAISSLKKALPSSRPRRSRWFLPAQSRL